MIRNPDWTREEMILALDLYHRIDVSKADWSHPEVVLLSERLRSFPFHPPGVRTQTFRNPTGILMTLRTLMRYDPLRGERGLRGGKLGREVWNEFHNRRFELQQITEAILAAAKVLQHVKQGETPPEAFEEGGVLFRLHRLHERNRHLVARKKAQALRERGNLACEACDFDFAASYGPWGHGYIECHHRKPLSELSGRGSVRLKDVALVCANCHRVLHLRRPMPTVAELKTIIRSGGK